MEVEIISTEFIKPSSPTPSHLRTYKLSLLDQFAPHVYFPHLVFYPANEISISETSQVLKQSLSKTLALYYPLAGKANDSLSIDCDDNGACYINARVNGNLRDYLKQPTLSTLAKVLPQEACKEVPPGARVVVIQETLFSCGCIAIAFVVPHSIFDAAAISTFMRTWASIARDPNDGGLFPDFTASSIFPQNTTSVPQNSTSLTAAIVGKGEFVVKRFVFDGSVINSLKDKAISSGVQNPTRVEVVSGLLLKCLKSALMVKSGNPKSLCVTNTVNMRGKAVPPFSKSSVGNFLWLTSILSQGEDTELCTFVRQMREAISAINGDLVKRLEGDGGSKILSEFMKAFGESCSNALSRGAKAVGLNSWCNLGFYEADFGWGKPLWIPIICLAKPLPVFFMYLMDTRHGNGIEAWVVLDGEVMTLLERHEEFLSLALVDPNPLELVH
ncbi:(13S,14R)-1,13-dihydroxy-N-methylcanadine 13-O-acetyltransferase AT1-like isoform X1 [Tripterygium wilfordii]|uniref:(13S,14R)-1,13-dihydroxy-N-methylcanadine 13-O-acetyltransferase AT1-like isoform X1 n=1 Tax=Tripterygium wilfordii TaxID=458696 RepID=UPI0018F833A6|nr:(13S,14R)-1,13-dihydroxy-N-methylcanadine 13-O-acetyltransferase AT1-like isoform X1 [Tripterygium wilfordii]XP_038698234.1 (13S,14R)-1,13-dihydroxy-N-methylcanadine 13-O-acetyltransferase AT1-like isoform X1 [Tripterygium wilfordii]